MVFPIKEAFSPNGTLQYGVRFLLPLFSLQVIDVTSTFYENGCLVQRYFDTVVA